MAYKSQFKKESKKGESKFGSFVSRALVRLFVILVFSAAILFGLSKISKIEKLRVSSVEVEGAAFANDDAIKRFVEEKLEGQYLGLFAKNNIILVSSPKVSQKIEENFPEVKKAEGEIKDRTLFISLSEYKPKYLWCGELYEEMPESAPECYYVAEDGYIFSRSPYFSGPVYFKFYAPLVDKENPASGQTVLPNDEFEKFTLFKEHVANILPVRMETCMFSDETKDVTCFLSRRITRRAELPAPKILFERESDYKVLAAHLKAAIGEENLAAKLEANLDKLLYFDLRFPGKVYYKFGE